MRGNTILGVSLISAIFDAEALFARDLESLDPPQQFGGLSSEHGAHNQLNSASLLELVESLEVSLVFSEWVGPLTELFAQKKLFVEMLSHQWTRWG
jgi:hypothetical protein